MPLFTRKEVRQAAAEVTRSLADGVTLEEALFESQTDAYFTRQALDWESREAGEFDIFLSHAYADKILTPAKLKKGTGYFGASTKKFINDYIKINEIKF